MIEGMAEAAESWASTPGSRSSMRGNTRRDTKPEVALRKALHARGMRFRKDFRIDLDGTRFRPDVVFTRAKVAVFVDGCFWHSCPMHGTTPKRNADYWIPKLARNVTRDRAQDAALEGSGWTSVRIWEHEDPATAAERVARALRTHAAGTAAIGHVGAPGR